MLVGVVASGAASLLIYLLLRRRLGPLSAGAFALLFWSLVVLAIITLVPPNGAPGIVPAGDRLGTCSTDLGGPAPEGFWIFGGGQRLLNTVVFIPSGALLVIAAARWRSAWITVPIGSAGLAAYSVGIELTQLELARLDRACDVTDMVDNAAGAAIGVAIGIPLALVLRPWRHRSGGTRPATARDYL